MQEHGDSEESPCRLLKAEQKESSYCSAICFLRSHCKYSAYQLMDTHYMSGSLLHN